MTAQPIDETRLQATARRHGIDWIYSQTTASTNADALRHFTQHRRENVAVSEAQSAGRGRRGRRWHSPFAQNIYCTIGLLKLLPPSSQGLLSIVTGIALCRALQQSAAAAVKLKWPNDLLFDGRKLGGILIESRTDDDGQIFFAVGFGLNLSMSDAELAAIAQPVTSLDRVAAGNIDRSRVLSCAIDSVVSSIRAFEPSRVDDLIADFQQYDAFHGEQVEVISGHRRITGVNRGIGVDGQLQLETEHGIQLHSAAEISLRPAVE